MQTVTGSPLYSGDGERIGEIIDVLGIYEGTEDFGWLAVKVSWRTKRLVPNQGVEPFQDGFQTPFSKEQIERAPKVPPHFEPSGDDHEALCSHYGVRLAGL